MNESRCAVPKCHPYGEESTKISISYCFKIGVYISFLKYFNILFELCKITIFEGTANRNIVTVSSPKCQCKSPDIIAFFKL